MLLDQRGLSVLPHRERSYAMLHRGRTAMMGVVLILAACLPAGPVLGADITFDAAELDRHGEDIRSQWGYLMPCFRVIADNTEGLTPLTMPEFELNYSGGALNTWGGFAFDDPDNPWYGAREDDPSCFILGGMRYTLTMIHTGFSPDDYWTFSYYVDPTPENLEDWMNDYQVYEIPVGVCLDAPMFIANQSADMYLFLSPATGAFTASGETTDVIDYDRTPQTIPEPLTVALLASGALIIARKRYVSTRPL